MLEFLFDRLAPALAAGVLLFVWGLKIGRIRNNKYVAKFIVDVVGASTTGVMVSVLVDRASVGGVPDGVHLRSLVAFAVGLCWSEVVHWLRRWITGIVGGFPGGGPEDSP